MDADASIGHDPSFLPNKVRLVMVNVESSGGLRI